MYHKEILFLRKISKYFAITTFSLCIGSTGAFSFEAFGDQQEKLNHVILTQSFNTNPNEEMYETSMKLLELLITGQHNKDNLYDGYGVLKTSYCEIQLGSISEGDREVDGDDFLERIYLDFSMGIKFLDFSEEGGTYYVELETVERVGFRYCDLDKWKSWHNYKYSSCDSMDYEEDDYTSFGFDSSEDAKNAQLAFMVLGDYCSN